MSQSVMLVPSITVGLEWGIGLVGRARWMRRVSIRRSSVATTGC